MIRASWKELFRLACVILPTYKNKSIYFNGLQKKVSNFFISSISKDYQHSFYNQHNVHGILSIFFLLPIGYLLNRDNDCDYECNCEGKDEDKEKVSGTELVKTLKDRISILRYRLLNKGRSFTTLNVYKSNDYDIIGIHFEDLSIDILSLLVQWFSLLPTKQSGIDLKSSSSFYNAAAVSNGNDNRSNDIRTNTNNTKDGTSFTMERLDKSLGITIDKLYPNNYSIRVYSKGGFLNQEIDTILRGYYECFATQSSSSSIVSIDSLSDTLLNSLFKGFNFDDNDNDNSNNTNDKINNNKPSFGSRNMRQNQDSYDPIQQLQSLGIEVYDRNQNFNLSWDSLAGYQNVKRTIEETVINAYKYPEIYDSIARKTRTVFEHNRPKAILLEGDPGTGKTLTARILANRCDKPFIHLKLESIVSKWYGESEKKLGKVFDLCDELEGAIIFIDEVDSIASSRDTNQIHEATKHLLSVILQRIEGFEGKGKSLLVCATNRKHDLDAALLSRFDISIHYELPDLQTRKDIYRYYAKQFAKNEIVLENLAKASDGFSCRDLKETCEFTERRWASRIIMKDKNVKGDIPGEKEYLEAILYRKRFIRNELVQSDDITV